MTLANDILLQAGIRPANTAATTTPTARGPVRLKKDGTPDKRSLLRGIAKPHPSRGIQSYEKKQLLKMFQSAKPGDVFAWKWRSRRTYVDRTLRNRQTQYAYAAANEFGYKISLQSLSKHLQITMVSIAD